MSLIINQNGLKPNILYGTNIIARIQNVSEVVWDKGKLKVEFEILVLYEHHFILKILILLELILYTALKQDLNLNINHR